mmetsp:Transcript_7203/g.12827  ORF Transcript_7203/g.12827 Transcript_7203/m.12827 type:complete len:217 (+) Transcript_7203:544-1194(+)
MNRCSTNHFNLANVCIHRIVNDSGIFIGGLQWSACIIRIHPTAEFFKVQLAITIHVKIRNDLGSRTSGEFLCREATGEGLCFRRSRQVQAVYTQEVTLDLIFIKKAIVIFIKEGKRSLGFAVCRITREKSNTSRKFSKVYCARVVSIKDVKECIVYQRKHLDVTRREFIPIDKFRNNLAEIFRGQETIFINHKCKLLENIPLCPLAETGDTFEFVN